MKNVIITGGNDGIGAKCAEIFNNKDYKVFILDVNVNKQNNDNIEYYTCDISNYNEVEKVSKKILKKVKKIDIIINNAAIQIDESFEKYNIEKWQKVMNTNYFGTCNIIHTFLKKMNADSTILNILSVHSSKPRTNKYVYDSSKSALEILTKELAIELATKKITINGLSFGAVDTNMNKNWKKDISKKDEARKKVPLKIIFTPDEIATFVYKIINDYSKYTTGSIFVIDGGRSLI